MDYATTVKCMRPYSGSTSRRNITQKRHAESLIPTPKF